MNAERSHSDHVAEAKNDAAAMDPLKKALRRIRSTKDFPSISKYFAEINQKLTEQPADASASELANVILKDYALTNKLLKLVNSAFYGFVTGKVSTVTRAVVLLGYENVRLAAISLVLFEHFKSKTMVRDLKDATISSFWCGLIAKEIAKEITQKDNVIDAEEAFICGLLHQLGKLLTIYHMPLEYREIKFRVTRQEENERQAVRHVLGITYEALGVAVAQQWNFPESIFKTMVPLTDEELEDKDKSIELLCALANFTNELCRIIDTVRFDRRKSAIESLLELYRHHIVISEKQLQATMESCLDKLFKHADALQFTVEESGFLIRLSGEQHQSPKKPGRKIDGAEDAGPAFRLSGASDIAASDAVYNPEDAVGIIMAGIQEISSAMMGDNDINDIASMSLESIYRALQCQRAIMFIHESRSGKMEARYGFGTGVQHLVGDIKFKLDMPDENDLFLQAMHTGKDLIVEDAHAPELRQMIPDWYRRSIDAKAFVFMPIGFQNIYVGAYYGDLDFAGPLINALEHKYLAMLRNQLILAIKMGR